MMQDDTWLSLGDGRVRDPRGVIYEETGDGGLRVVAHPAGSLEDAAAPRLGDDDFPDASPNPLDHLAARQAVFPPFPRADPALGNPYIRPQRVAERKAKHGPGPKRGIVTLVEARDLPEPVPARALRAAPVSPRSVPAPSLASLRDNKSYIPGTDPRESDRGTNRYGFDRLLPGERVHIQGDAEETISARMSRAQEASVLEAARRNDLDETIARLERYTGVRSNPQHRASVAAALRNYQKHPKAGIVIGYGAADAAVSAAEKQKNFANYLEPEKEKRRKENGVLSGVRGAESGLSFGASRYIKAAGRTINGDPYLGALSMLANPGWAAMQLWRNRASFEDNLKHERAIDESDYEVHPTARFLGEVGGSAASGWGTGAALKLAAGARTGMLANALRQPWAGDAAQGVLSGMISSGGDPIEAAKTTAVSVGVGKAMRAGARAALPHMRLLQREQRLSPAELRIAEALRRQAGTPERARARLGELAGRGPAAPVDLGGVPQDLLARIRFWSPEVKASSTRFFLERARSADDRIREAVQPLPRRVRAKLLDALGAMPEKSNRAAHLMEMVKRNDLLEGVRNRRAVERFVQRLEFEGRAFGANSRLGHPGARTQYLTAEDERVFQHGWNAASARREAAELLQDPVRAREILKTLRRNEAIRRLNGKSTLPEYSALVPSAGLGVAYGQRERFLDRRNRRKP